MTAGCRREEKDKRVEDVQDKLCLVSCSAHCSQSSAGGSEAARSTPSHPRTQVHTLSLADDRVFLCCNYASALRPSTGLKVQRLQACYVPCVSRDTWHCKSLCCSLTCVGECRTHRFCTEARGWFILIVIATRPSQVSAPAAAVIVAVAKLNVSRASTLDSSAQCDSKNRDATPPIIPPSTTYLPTPSTAPPDIARLQQAHTKHTTLPYHTILPYTPCPTSRTASPSSEAPSHSAQGRRKFPCVRELV
mgnify:CR=1 FL=1